MPYDNYSGAFSSLMGEHGLACGDELCRRGRGGGTRRSKRSFAEAQRVSTRANRGLNCPRYAAWKKRRLDERGWKIESHEHTGLLVLNKVEGQTD